MVRHPCLVRMHFNKIRRVILKTKIDTKECSLVHKRITELNIQTLYDVAMASDIFFFILYTAFKYGFI